MRNRVNFPIPNSSNNPSIPNFEILGRIGGGAYGEVFLAKTVTGMFRAVKVVSREDFEYERTFEREFEGIQRYEQVSKDHPGLVDVLHVGRDKEAGFYYYVMELADDESGESDDIDPDTYKARTLSSDLRGQERLSVLDTVKLGISLANALGHLHAAGLTHRDVKPSNIIFVKGAPKLADVGLVAESGQRTFVGTEGYVPPEGPGTSSADLYSLAMVLYEAHTRKDRLDFPELPTNLEIPPTVDRDEWRALNAVICRAGSPDPKKRFESAQILALALRKVVSKGGRERKSSPAKRGARMVMTVLVLGLLSAAGYGGYWLWKDSEKFKQSNADLLAGNNSSEDADEETISGDNGGETGGDTSAEQSDKGKGKGKGTTDITGTEDETEEDPPFVLIDPDKDQTMDGGVVIQDEVDPGTDDEDSPSEEESESDQTGKESEMADAGSSDQTEDDTPVVVVVEGQVNVRTQPSGAAVWVNGKEVGITPRPLRLPVGTVDLILRHPGYHPWKGQLVVEEGLEFFEKVLVPDLRPAPGQPWVNSVGMAFEADASGQYLATQSVTPPMFARFKEVTGSLAPLNGFQGVVQVRDEKVRWAFADWVTSQDQASGYLSPDQYFRPLSASESSLDDSFTLVVENRVGTVLLNSDPPGAEVYRDGRLIGNTPLTVNDLRLGPYELELRYPGYEVKQVEGVVLDDRLPIAELVSLSKDASVVFGVPWNNLQGMPMVPVGILMVAAYETPIMDYREYVTDMQIAMPASSIAQALNHPVVGVTRNEAEAFCEWLTLRERREGMIRQEQRYRLPTDSEWSAIAGLTLESGGTPAERGVNGPESFLWGDSWPPELGAGNFADKAAADLLRNYVIEGYTDGFPVTSPIGNFSPTAQGVYDLAGNVWEWVSDAYQPATPDIGLVRGGGWNTYEQGMLSTSYRSAVPVAAREDFYGFRYVLEDTAVRP